MKVVPREAEKLNVNNAGFLAQTRLARGLRLNHPEAAALIATQILEFVLNGDKSVAELMDIGRQLLASGLPSFYPINQFCTPNFAWLLKIDQHGTFSNRKQVLPGVQYLLDMVQVEGTFPDGNKLITIHHSPFTIQFLGITEIWN